MVVARPLLIVLVAHVFCQSLSNRYVTSFSQSQYHAHKEVPAHSFIALEGDQAINGSDSATFGTGSVSGGNIETLVEEPQRVKVSENKLKKDSPIKRLFLTLFKSLACIVLGASCKYFSCIVPEKGHMHALGFFVGKIALPLLVFKVIALTNLGDVDIRVILACNIAKVLVLGVTFAVTYLAYQRHRSKGQRVLTATVFGVFAITSNDYVLGFPVINSLYGQSMEVYLSANALVGQAVLLPIIMVLFGVGRSMKAAEEGREGEGEALHTLKDIALNPIVVATFLGFIGNLLKDKLFMEEGQIATSQPFLLVLDLLTAPFITLALFLTGVSLRSPSITTWSCLLVLMKVVVCAYLSYILAEFFGKLPTDLQDFSYFYGSIPTGSAALVFAAEFDPSVVDIIATSILLGLCAAGPNMMVTSLFMGGEMQDRTDMLDSTITIVVRVGIFAGVVFAYIQGMSFFRDSSWSLAKRWIGVYGIAALLYTIWMLTLSVEGYKCYYVSAAHFPCKQRVIFNTLQKALVLIVFYLQFNLSTGWAHRTQELRGGFLRCLLLGVIAIFAGIFTSPFTLPTLCNQADILKDSQKISYPIVSGFCLVVTIALAVLDFRANVASNPSPLSESVPASETAEAAREQILPDVQESTPLERFDGAFTIRTLFRLQGLRLLLQLVNSWSAFNGAHAQGVFAHMLLIECILEHSQIINLLVALLFDASYKGEIEYGITFSGTTSFSNKLHSSESLYAVMLAEAAAQDYIRSCREEEVTPSSQKQL